MGEKEGKRDDKEKKPEGEKKKEGGDGGKKDDGMITVVMKVEMHCEGCASKVKRSVKGFEGVDSVSADLSTNKLTVVGKVDPWTIRDRVESKTRKKVDLVSPANAPKPKEKGGGGGDSKDQKKKAEEKKPKTPSESTVVLKIRLHCEGCIQRIRKTVYKMKGVTQVSVDAGKDLVTVKGTMDAKALPEILKEKFNRSVEVVPPKKDDAGEKKGGGGGGGGGDGEKKGGGGGDGEKKGGDGGGAKKEEAVEKSAAPPPAPATAMEVNKMEQYMMYGGPPVFAPAPYSYGGPTAFPPAPYSYGGPPAFPPAPYSYGGPPAFPPAPYSYGGPPAFAPAPAPYSYHMEMAHAPQMFSDENPNACSVM